MVGIEDFNARRIMMDELPVPLRFPVVVIVDLIGQYS